MQNVMEAARIQNDLDDIYEDEDTQKDKYLTFNLASEGYAIGIAHVNEIIGIQDITLIPEMPDFIRGVINLRGHVIPVMDVRTRFRLKPRDYDSRTCIVVVSIAENFMGLIVDEVSEVLDIPETEVEPPPKTSGQKLHRFISGLGKKDSGVKIILDVDRLLFSEELGQLAEAIH